MAIQNRRGIYASLDANKLVPGEFAFCMDTGALYYCFAPGSFKVLATSTDLQSILDSSPTAYTALQELIADFEADTSLSATILNKLATLKTMMVEATGYGVISGGQVTAQATPNMTVNVPAMKIHMPNGDRFEFTDVVVLTANPADTANPRTDIFYVSADGIRSYLAGTPAATPVAPTLPSGGQLLAQLAVAANQTTITTANITDKRLMKYSNNTLMNYINGKAPTAHATSSNMYGLGSVTNYGHVKTVDGLAQASYLDGTALNAHQGYVLDQNKINKTDIAQTDTVNDSTKVPSTAVTYGLGQEIDTINASLNKTKQYTLISSGTLFDLVTAATQNTCYYIANGYHPSDMPTDFASGDEGFVEIRVDNGGNRKQVVLTGCYAARGKIWVTDSWQGSEIASKWTLI